MVTGAIIQRMHHLIDWPNDADLRRRIAHGFFNLSTPGIPNVCGALDGSLIPIEAPSEDEYQYVDRHHQHSLNAMAVSGPNLYFYSFSCRWPGSLHDGRVLQNSGLYTKFEALIFKNYEFIFNLRH